MPDRQPVPEPVDVVKDLRTRVLSVLPADLGISPSQQLPNVWGILMEMGYPETLAGLVVLADGTTSLYLGHGGGFMDGGEHASVRTASARFLSVANRYHAELQTTHTFPYPDVGRVTFYVLTFSGILFADADEEELLQKAHSLAELFHAGHGVLTELRLIEQEGTEEDDAAWAGESGYVNCLLTTLAEGPREAVILSSRSPVPPLLPLAEGDERLSAWVRRLRFAYEELDTGEVCGILMKSAGLSRRNPFQRKGYFNAFLIPSDPESGPVPMQFVVEKTRGLEGEFALRVTQGGA